MRQRYFEILSYCSVKLMTTPNFPILLTVFRRFQGTKQGLLKILEKWKHLSENGYYIGVAFMNL